MFKNNLSLELITLRLLKKEISSQLMKLKKKKKKTLNMKFRQRREMKQWEVNLLLILANRIRVVI